MTQKEALSRTREILTANDIEEASLESELLLRHALKIGRVQLFLEFDQKLTGEQAETFWQLIQRRLRHEPIAYIIGHREFYGLDFYVDRNVLIPRPESELLVEKARQLALNYALPTIADVGTGSGAIAISLALSLPQAKIYATDISVAALSVAQFNCLQHGVTDRVSLLAGDMLQPLVAPVDIIVANLPYVREEDLAQTGLLNFEPRLALNGGSDGLERIRRLSRQAGDKLRPGGSFLIEIGQGQRKMVTTFLRGLFPSAKIEVAPDLSGIDRVVSLTLPAPSSQKPYPNPPKNLSFLKENSAKQSGQPIFLV